MQTTLENRKKATTKSPINVLKRNNIIKEGGTLGLELKGNNKA
jgi:hypothetical protein